MAEKEKEVETIEDMYQHYLNKVKLKESKMLEVQKTETRRAFFAGVSSFYKFQEIWAVQSDKIFSERLDSVYAECQNFWVQQLKS